MTLMNEHLPTIFESYAKEVLSSIPEINSEWEIKDNGDKKKLTIKRINSTGFDVVAECETYGLYPFAGEWHGPAWELFSGSETYFDLCKQFMGFIRSLLCEDSKLEVRYSSEKPYKWLLTYTTEDGIETQETGLMFYNYFGKKSCKVFQNVHLPRRYE